MNKTEYKIFTNSMIKCTGKWCITIDGVKQFGCTSETYDRCYRADQIISGGNKIKELEGCSLDVMGNFIMSYSVWEQETFTGYYGEKNMIYGSNIVRTAYDSIYYSCYYKKPTSYPDELCLYQFDTTLLILLLVSIFIISIFLVLLYVRYKHVYNDYYVDGEITMSI
jgi:hypothetical protein